MDHPPAVLPTMSSPLAAPAEEPPAPPSAREELERIRSEMPQLLAALSERLALGAPAFPLLWFDAPQRVIRVDAALAGDLSQWVFIGDIHGDFFALHTLLREAVRDRPDSRIFFLGDLIDRGEQPLECLFLLLEWGLRHPGRLAWIAGNHDIALRSKDDGSFVSEVSPAEFCSLLNTDDAMMGFRQKAGLFFIEIGRRLPRAVLFPDGLLATHGGFPLVDLHTQVSATINENEFLAWLNSDACLKDFSWTRIHRAPRKIPDRFSSGASYGFTDFEAFCKLRPDWFGVRRMITGHEHPTQGFDTHPTYKANPALTLVGFGLNEMKPGYAYYTDNLHFARGMPDAMPALVPVKVDRTELAAFIGDPSIAPPVPSLPTTSSSVPTKDHP